MFVNWPDQVLLAWFGPAVKTAQPLSSINMSSFPKGCPGRPLTPPEIPSRESELRHEAEDQERLLTKRELARKLNLPSTRSIDELVRRKALPVIRFGWRTLRFSPRAIELAIEKLTVRSI